MVYLWIRGIDSYLSEPAGDTLEVAHRLFKKYINYYTFNRNVISN